MAGEKRKAADNCVVFGLGLIFILSCSIGMGISFQYASFSPEVRGIIIEPFVILWIVALFAMSTLLYIQFSTPNEDEVVHTVPVARREESTRASEFSVSVGSVV